MWGALGYLSETCGGGLANGIQDLRETQVFLEMQKEAGQGAAGQLKLY